MLPVPGCCCWFVADSCVDFNCCCWSEFPDVCAWNCDVAGSIENVSITCCCGCVVPSLAKVLEINWSAGCWWFDWGLSIFGAG